MLTPKTIAQLPEDLVAMVSKLQDDIVASISAKLVKADYLTPSAEWQLYKANQLRMSSEEVVAFIAKSSGKRKRELQKLYTEACKEAINTDAKIYRDFGKDCGSFFRSAAFSNALKAGIKNANGLLGNLCKTTARTATGLFERYLDSAYLQVLSGAFTPAEAIFTAVQRLAVDGMQTITYPTGKREQIDVAVRRGVVTGVGQTTGQMQLDLAAKMGCDLVEVTSHLGARPAHALWQGGIFSISGSSKKYRKLSEATGYGSGAGLKGWNCRHDFFPFFEGISVPSTEKFDSEENKREYENSQRQRYYERTIRASKRRLIAYDSAISEASDNGLKRKLQRQFAKTSVTLKRQEAGLKAFVGRTGRYVEASRVRVNGSGRSLSGKAVAAKKRVEKSSLLAPGGIDKKSLGRYNKDGFYLSDEIERLKIAINSAPQKYKSALNSAIESVGFLESEHSAPYAYSEQLDAILYNTSARSFYNMKFEDAVMHELAHKIDIASVHSFESTAFLRAIEGYADFDFSKLSADLAKIDLNENGYLSDILSALSNNNISKLETGHENKYWQKQGAKQKEVFADLFAMDAFNDEIGVSFVQKYFGNIHIIYNELIERL